MPPTMGGTIPPAQVSDESLGSNPRWSGWIYNVSVIPIAALVGVLAQQEFPEIFMSPKCSIVME